MAKKKRPLPPKKKEEAEAPGKKERPWWARPDAELVKDRYGRIKEVYDSVKIKVDDEDRDAIIKEAVKMDPRIVNFLDMVPVRMKGIGKNKEFLLVPIYETRRGECIAKLIKLRTRRRIKLDDYGWMVWKLIDGRRDIRKIGKILKQRYGNDVEPLYPRISKFMAYLQTLKLIEIERPRKD